MGSAFFLWPVLTGRGGLPPGVQVEGEGGEDFLFFHKDDNLKISTIYRSCFVHALDHLYVTNDKIAILFPNTIREALKKQSLNI